MLGEKFKPFLAFLLVVLLLLVSCSSDESTLTNLPPAIPTIVIATFSKPTTNVPTPTTIPSQEWSTRWLRGIPCSPPCFEGVTPGKTTATEAQKILQPNPLIRGFKVEASSPIIIPEAYIVWFWNQDIIGKKPSNARGEGGLIRYNDRDSTNIIKVIEPGLLPFKLADVIQAYGEPSHVIATFSRKNHESGYWYSLTFFYFSSGFLVKNNPIEVRPELKKDMLLEYIEFFPPGIDAYPYYSENFFAKTMLVPWQGFKDWKFYCRYIYDTEKHVSNCDDVQNL